MAALKEAGVLADGVKTVSYGYIGTDMVNPDFVKLGEAHGAHTERVLETAECTPAFERARASGKLALIEIRLDANVLTPTATVDSLRARAK